MDNERLPRVSLPAQFDDLFRCMKVLSKGIEPEFKTFVDAQSKLRYKLKQSEYELRKMQDKISSLQSENGRLDTKLKHINNLLNDALSARKRVEAEKDSLAKQIEIIKEVLLSDAAVDNQTKQKLVTLSSTCKLNSPPRLNTIEESMGSLFSLSDIDQTDEDLDLHRSRGKRRSSERRSSNKKKRLEESEKSATKVKEIGDMPVMNVDYTSTSEQTGSSPEIPAYQNRQTDSASAQSKEYPYDLRRSNTGSLSLGTPVGLSGKKVRNHVFVTKTVMNRVKCNPCGRYIGYVKQVLKCQNCRVVCHPECKEKCPTPCFPIVNTPTKGNPGTIADYTSSTSPMIPPLIVHCVNEIESRGLKEIGLYRISGSERDVKTLKEKFVVGRTIPCLSDVDIHAICGTVKEFLRSLKEPLITRSAWQSFIDAADMKNETFSLNAIYEIVMDLPQPNRDTLAFLILHLQKIAETPEVKMSVDNLARVFGPTIVGYSESELNQMNMLVETSQQHLVMHRLLSIPSDSWQNMLNFELDGLIGFSRKTPEKLPAPKGTRLGPIYTPVQKSKTMSGGINPFTPRNNKYNNKPTRMQFASPFLK